jgi:hypothetical protein
MEVALANYPEVVFALYLGTASSLRVAVSISMIDRPRSSAPRAMPPRPASVRSSAPRHVVPLIEPLDFNLGLLVLGGFDNVLTLVSPCFGNWRVRTTSWTSTAPQAASG